MRAVITQAISFSCAAAVLVLSNTAAAWATVAVVPEINPSMITTGLGALGAGVLILRARRRSK